MKPYLLPVLLILSLQISKADALSCQEHKFEVYSQAKIDYQVRLTQLIESSYPKLSAIAKTYMDDQLIRIEKRRIEFNYLQSNDPESLNTDKPLNSWVNTSDAQRKDIATKSSRYAKLLSDIEASKKRPSTSDGEELRRIMRQNIISTDEFLIISKALSETIQELNRKACP